MDDNLVVINLTELSKMDSVMAQEYITRLLNISYEDWFVGASKIYYDEITAANIPQYSNFEDGSLRVIKILRQMGDYGPGYEKIGRYLLTDGKKKSAYTKYGENHAKLGILLGFLYCNKEGKTHIHLNDFGKAFEKLDPESQLNIIHKRILKIPIIQKISFNEKITDIYSELCIYLSEKTAKRRTSNVKKIMRIIEKIYKGFDDENIYIKYK